AHPASCSIFSENSLKLRSGDEYATLCEATTIIKLCAARLVSERDRCFHKFRSSESLAAISSSDQFRTSSSRNRAKCSRPFLAAERPNKQGWCSAHHLRRQLYISSSVADELCNNSFARSMSSLNGRVIR